LGLFCIPGDGRLLARWADPTIAQPPRLKSSADNRSVVSRIVSQENNLPVCPAIRSRTDNTGDLSMAVSGEGKTNPTKRGNYMMELAEIVGDELVLENGEEREPVAVGKVGTRCVYATNHERGYVVVAVPQRFSRPASLSRGER
jgi:hypothetical protein